MNKKSKTKKTAATKAVAISGWFDVSLRDLYAQGQNCGDRIGLLRMAKQHWISRQKFDLAADARDQESALRKAVENANQTLGKEFPSNDKEEAPQ